jgi:putative membrane protein
MWHGVYYGGWGMVLIGAVFWASILALVIWAVVRLTGRASHDADPYRRKSPLELLKERYAKGEITKEQYEEIKRDLLS